MAYFDYAKNNGLYDSVKGSGKQNKSFRVSADPIKARQIGRVRARYMIKSENQCIRLLLPVGIAVQSIQPFSAFTFDNNYTEWLAKIRALFVDALPQTISA